MIEWVLGEIREIASEVIIVTTRKNLKGMSKFQSGARVLEDEIPALGPLGGVYTGLKHARCKISLVAPSDTPFISGDFMKFLVRSLGKHQAVVPRWPNGYLEALHVALKTDSALQAVMEAIESKSLSVRSIFEHLSDVEFVDIESLRRYDPQLLTFFNVNTREDLKKARGICERLVCDEGNG